MAGVHSRVPIGRDACHRQDVFPADVPDPDSVGRVVVVRQAGPVTVPVDRRPEIRSEEKVYF